MPKPIVLMLMLTVAVPALAGQSVLSPRNAARFGALRPAQSDPYRKLFAQQRTTPPPVMESQRAAKRKVVCGMTIISIEPKNDPSMVLEPNADGIEYTIRALDPPICNPR